LKPFIVAANWKMNKSPDDAEIFLKEFKAPAAAQAVIFPQALCAERVSRWIPAGVQWGGQNCHFEKAGAFTGENSPEILKKMGASWVLVGHSERRTLFEESDETAAKKIKAAQGCGLIPMLCLGETLMERDEGRMQAVIERQLREGLKLADFAQPLAVAYEPVWAIGTGRVASTEQVGEAHLFLRRILKNLTGAAVPLLYGGSVTPQNCGELSRVPEVNGFLVGGASLKADAFAAIAASFN
jgi:triosephosphate isomerase